MIRRGRVQVRYARLAGRETYLPSLDVRTVGIGGGSLIRAAGAELIGVGPRSAHIAGLPYACFADTAALEGAELVSIAPRAEDPADYLALQAADGSRYAITVTCAANAAGVVPAGSYARSDPDAANAALALLARLLNVSVVDTAKAVLELAVRPVREVVDQLIDAYRLERNTLALVGAAGERPPSPRTWAKCPHWTGGSPRTAR
ncbi:hydantoinase/oxoprolinase family protein [Amycolatopsis sp. H20-H5]|uniref:hydantoinase/oxoprolinase family protein n=1 Tax=Amycolatopsis sp. H20-H5 TaxID=3046309 RepID=UPI002DB9485B|nr:hydantoinase/oxoprolinase family protein [Amycolatopsis sp. H20-H5]MEC3976999.1 hydantoinase/oxoprolinase family protein [Amycolatopsis sp. H20-H5]